MCHRHMYWLPWQIILDNLHPAGGSGLLKSLSQNPLVLHHGFCRLGLWVPLTFEWSHQAIVAPSVNLTFLLQAVYFLTGVFIFTGLKNVELMPKLNLILFFNVLRPLSYQFQMYTVEGSTLYSLFDPRVVNQYWFAGLKQI